MIREERLLKVLKAPHISEKSTMVAEKLNTIVFKVATDLLKRKSKRQLKNCSK
jgi:large subunit ribosomal protein L23